MNPPELPPGDHCLKCRHRNACALPQRAEGKVCGWYNAAVEKLVVRKKTGTRTVSSGAPAPKA